MYIYYIVTDVQIIFNKPMKKLSFHLPGNNVKALI